MYHGHTVLGIDIGTTSISVVVVDLSNGDNLFSNSVIHRASLPPDVAGASLQDPTVLLNTTETLLESALSEIPDVRAIGVTGQMHGIVPVDGHGRPTGPAYTWMDKRSEVYYDRMAVEIGTSIPSGYGAATLFALMQSGTLDPKTSDVASIPAWIAGQLARVTSCAVSEGLGHSLGLYSLAEKAFDQDAWRKISSFGPPEIGTDATFIGETSSGIPVCVPEGDNQASFLATVREPDRAISFNIGTSGQVTLLESTDSISEDLKGLEARPFPGKRVILTGASLAGGKSFEILTNLINEIAHVAGASVNDPFTLVADLERPHDLPVVQTTFAGTRTDPSIRGVISSIGFDNFSVAHLYWGIADGVISELHGMAKEHLSILDKPESYIVVSGNALRRSVAMQSILSEKVQRPVFQLAHQEEAARGAAMLAGAAEAGGITRIAEIQRRAVRYRPLCD